MAAPPVSKKDAQQVIRHAFDDDTGRIRVDAEITVTSLDVNIDAASGDNIAISDGTNTMSVNPDGSINTVVEGNLDVEIDAVDGDNIAIADAITGDSMTVRPDGNATVILSNALITDPFDYVSATYPSSSVEVYTYRNGGVSGTIIGVITVSYTDASKALLLNVAKV